MADTQARISIVGKDDTGPAFNSVQLSIQKLQVAAATTGKSAADTKLYELSLRGASAAQLDAARSALKLSESYARGAEIGNTIKTGLLTLGAAAATGLIAATVAFDQLIKRAGQFQDLSETTGASAEGLASIAVAAATAGVSMESVASSTIKLTKNLTGVDDEGKAAGAALAALGINIQEFKKLDPIAQFDAIGKALSGFADGAGKTAVAVALYGKAGAEQLKVFKAVEEQGGRQIILTAEQIRQADDYADKQAKSRAQLALYASAISTQAIPALTVLTESLSDAAKELLGVDANAKKLSSGSAVADFARESAIALAGTLDMIRNVADGFLFVGKSFGASAAIIAAAAKANFSEIGAIIAAAREDGLKLFNNDFQGRVIAKFEASQRDASNFDNEARRRAGRGDGKPQLSFEGAATKTGAGKGSAGSEAKAQLALDIEDIRKANESLIATYANAEKVIEAQRSANLLSDREFFDAKRGFLNLNNDAQEAALSKELARLQAEKLSGKDRIDNARKILDVQSKLDKVREASFTNLEVLKTGEKAYFKRLTDGYIEAEAAARNYLNTLRLQQDRETAGLGQGAVARNRNAGVNQIEDKFTEQRLRLSEDLRRNVFIGREDDYQKELNLISRSEAEAVQIFSDGYDRRIEVQKNWQIGASEAFKNYYDEAINTSKQVEEAFTNAFKGLEDGLINFVKTGKLDFKSLADSIATDLIRIEVKKSVTGPLAGLLGGLGLGDTVAKTAKGAAGALGIGGAAAGAGEAAGAAAAQLNATAQATAAATIAAASASSSASLTFLATAAQAAAAALAAIAGSSSIASAASAAGGDSLDNFIGLLGLGGRAIGGPVGAGGLYRVNEKGPELLNVAGKQYLMMGNQSGSVTPNSALSSGQPVIVNNNFVVSGPIDRRSQQQIASAGAAGVQRAVARS